MRVFSLAPIGPVVPLIRSCYCGSRLAQYAGLGFFLFLVFLIPYSLAKDVMVPPRVSCYLPALGALVRMKCTGTAGETACWKDAGDGSGYGVCGFLWKRACPCHVAKRWPLEALCKQDILPIR